MAKSEMNNEFILLRHAVRQARVCIVNKLIKEAKLLRDRHGNEAQKEKCTRKADKLIDEVYALKTIKDDDISKFGLLDERSLTKILQDQSSSSSVRIMARVTNYKTLNKRLTQFKERFPDYKHLTEKKKTTKLKNKNTVKTRKVKENNSQNKSSKKQKVVADKNVEQPQHDSEDEEACKKELSEVRSNSRKRKKTLAEDCTSLKKQKSLKLGKDSTSETTSVTDKQPNVIKPSSITKEAKVKRFTELLEEQETNQDAQMSTESQDSAGTATEQAKVVDDFFMTADGQNYQGSSASTSYTKSHRHNTRAKLLQLNDRVKKQNVNHKNDTNLNKKPPGKQSFSMKSKKMTPNKINNRTNNSNTNRNTIVNKKDDNVDLHPSWMAKKKEQEIMSKGFQGKKIVFTDD
ncbi:Serum response factor-binding protein 1 [Trachymyrmex septentrionalis]|uniref:Serum response factor-binding protein 1 n=1 Tax=Trachymyrmex septentrionalis TaxID=34720 RepID=A0A151JUX6_9HYME|nr:PREDICTED: serum response factor-binding protein 1-like [Trachymyrmex septentrionalis]KYN37333.1 Serum response factor-binding protein 1 [Trachymyrmex septentrionalis]